MRKSNIATDADEADEAGHAAGHANAALARGQLLTPRLRAVALRQKANAHVLLGERDEFARAHDAAHIAAAAGMSQDEDDAAPYCTPSYVEMEAWASLVRLGCPAEAIPIFEKSRSRRGLRSDSPLACGFVRAGTPKIYGKHIPGAHAVVGAPGARPVTAMVPAPEGRGGRWVMTGGAGRGSPGAPATATRLVSSVMRSAPGTLTCKATGPRHTSRHAGFLPAPRPRTVKGPVQQDQHARAQQVQQPPRQGSLIPLRCRAHRGAEQAAGTGLGQRHQPQRRVPGQAIRLRIFPIQQRLRSVSGIFTELQPSNATVRSPPKRTPEYAAEPAAPPLPRTAPSAAPGPDGGAGPAALSPTAAAGPGQPARRSASPRPSRIPAAGTSRARARSTPRLARAGSAAAAARSRQTASTLLPSGSRTKAP